MSNVQLPPKEGNLFKRILVSGRRPRCHPGPARRTIRRRRRLLRGPLRSLLRVPHDLPARPPRPSPLGRLLPSPACSAWPGLSSRLPETSRRPLQSLRAGARRRGGGPVPRAAPASSLRTSPLPVFCEPPLCLVSFTALCLSDCTAHAHSY